MPAEDGAALPQGNNDTFVIQEHHARALHWDFRLERDGVLVSWAVPKGLPEHPKDNHLAVHTEDHPLEYASFAGDIPASEYGGGNVMLWDRGRYETEKWSDREVMVVLHGQRARGRYVLFATGRSGRDWMIHRMDPPRRPDWERLPESVEPMLATDGRLPPQAKDAEWAYEFDWDGIRAIAYVDGGRLRLVGSAEGDAGARRKSTSLALSPSCATWARRWGPRRWFSTASSWRSALAAVRIPPGCSGGCSGGCRPAART